MVRRRKKTSIIALFITFGIIVFLADHGDMLFNHNMVAKRLMYEESARVPLIFAGRSILERKESIDRSKLASLADVMPTLLSLCDIDIPGTVEGIPLFTEKRHEYLYGEVSEGEKATRMIRDRDYKLIYYPCGNIFQLFDMKTDRKEMHDLASDSRYSEVLEHLKDLIVRNMYGKDLEYIKEGRLVGFEAPEIFKRKVDFGLYNQRGYHWPAPKGYSNIGRNA